MFRSTPYRVCITLSIRHKSKGRASIVDFTLDNVGSLSDCIRIARVGLCDAPICDPSDHQVDWSLEPWDQLKSAVRECRQTMPSSWLCSGKAALYRRGHFEETSIWTQMKVKVSESEWEEQMRANEKQMEAMESKWKQMESKWKANGE